MSNFRKLKEAQLTQNKKTIFFFWYYNTGYPEGTGRQKWSQYKPNLHVDLLNELTREIGTYPSGLKIDTTFIREEGGGVIRAKVKILADISWIQEVERSNIMDQKSPTIIQQQRDHQKRQKNQQSQQKRQETMDQGFLPDFSKGTRDSFVSAVKMHGLYMSFKDGNKEVTIRNDHMGWTDFNIFADFISKKLIEVGFIQIRAGGKQKWFEKKPLEKAILRLVKNQNLIKVNFHTLGEPAYTKQDNRYQSNQKQRRKQIRRRLRESNFQSQLENLQLEGFGSWSGEAKVGVVLAAATVGIAALSKLAVGVSTAIRNRRLSKRNQGTGKITNYDKDMTRIAAKLNRRIIASSDSVQIIEMEKFHKLDFSNLSSKEKEFLTDFALGVRKYLSKQEWIALTDYFDIKQNQGSINIDNINPKPYHNE